MINMSTEEGQIADRQLGEASQAMEDDGPVIEITEEQKFVDDGELLEVLVWRLWVSTLGTLYIPPQHIASLVFKSNIQIF